MPLQRPLFDNHLLCVFSSTGLQANHGVNKQFLQEISSEAPSDCTFLC